MKTDWVEVFLQGFRHRKGRADTCGADPIYQDTQAPRKYLSVYSDYFCFSQHLIKTHDLR